MADEVVKKKGAMSVSEAGRKGELVRVYR